MSFAMKEFAGLAAETIFLITAHDIADREAYYFLLADAENADALRALRKRPLDLNDYGAVIASGFGSTPTPNVLAYLKNKYGVSGL